MKPRPAHTENDVIADVKAMIKKIKVVRAVNPYVFPPIHLSCRCFFK